MISKFDDLIYLMYHYGYNCYNQSAHIIYFYMYKNALIAFVEVWFQANNYVSGSTIISSFLLSLFNIVFTTFQIFVAFYYEETYDQTTKLVSVSQFRRNLHKSIFRF